MATPTQQCISRGCNLQQGLDQFRHLTQSNKFTKTCLTCRSGQGPLLVLPAPPPPAALARFKTPWTVCQYGPAAAIRAGESRMILTVRPDPDDLLEVTDGARLHYEAKLFLRDTTSVPPLPSTEVGAIQSYRFPKATALIPRTVAAINRMRWVERFLQPDDMPEDGDLIDMCLLLQSLYSRNGMVVAAPTLRGDFGVQGDLRNNSLVYIKLVFINQAYQGQGLARILLDTYYRCLRRLPEFYACGDATTLVLQPANPGVQYGAAAYAGMTAAAIIAQLTRIYEALGFTIYRTRQLFNPDDGSPDGEPMTIMGQLLP